MRRGLVGLLFGLTLLGPLGCSQVRNPATGELQYTSLTPEDEKKLGREEHPKAVAEFGGRYQDKALQAYVAKVGNRVKERVRAGRPALHLHRARQRRGQRLRPAGRLCLRHARPAGADQQRGRARRGAGPRDRPRHRPPHRAALRPGPGRAARRHRGAARRHPAGRLSRRLAGCPARRPGGRPGRLARGARPTSRATRASRSSRPTSWGSAISAPPATIPAPWPPSWRHCRPRTPTGNAPPGGDSEESPLGDWFRSHPRTPDRVARAVEATSAEAPGAHETGRPALLAAIDGMLYGEDPAQGVIRGRSFLHPELRIGFEAPPGLQAAELAAAGGGCGRQGPLHGVRHGRGVPRRSAGLPARRLDQQAAPAGPAERRSRRPRGGGRVRAASPSAAAPPRRCSRSCAARAAPSTASSTPIPAGSTAPTSRTSSRACAASARSRRPRWRTSGRCGCAWCRCGPGDTVDSFARRMQVPQGTDPRALFVLLNGLDRGRELRPGRSGEDHHHGRRPAWPPEPIRPRLVRARASPPRSAAAAPARAGCPASWRMRAKARSWASGSR